MQKLPEDARGIGIQITRLEIMKSKARDMTLTSFVNKKKENEAIHRSSEINNINEVHTSTDSNFKLSTSKNITLANQQNVDVPPNINESILSELPEEIRNEILNAQKNKNSDTEINNREADNAEISKINEGKSQRLVQTHTENFFKQTKPGIPKQTKVEMPPIQEIDMSVLIELPEEIRNEILNEYSTKRNQDKTNVNTRENVGSSSTNNAVAVEISRDEENISFSQVDPEFLAALSEDLRRDVQMYCTARKAEYGTKIKKDETVRNDASTSGQNVPKENKKVERNSKTKNGGKNSKTSSSKNIKKKGIQAAFKPVENKKESEGILHKRNGNEITKPLTPRTANLGSVDDRLTADEAEAILSHNRTISEDNESAIQHEYSLINLVNRLLNLPLEQVELMITHLSL